MQPTLRLLADAARAAARSVLRGEELGLVVLPYLILALHRALQVEFVESPGGDPAALARDDRARLLGQAADLATGGACEANEAARRLHAISVQLIDHLSPPPPPQPPAPVQRA